MNYKKILKKIIYFSLFIFIFLFVNEFLYNGFVRMRENDEFIYFGFSGIDEMFKKEGEIKVYWKEYKKHELMGTDKQYLLYQNNKKRIIKNSAKVLSNSDLSIYNISCHVFQNNISIIFSLCYISRIFTNQL